MCKIYYFVQSLTYTASVLLLMAVAAERYIAILHPLRSRFLVTQTRLIISQIGIWVVSAAYNSPDLTMFNLYAVQKENSTVYFCFSTKPYTNMRNYYTVNFGLWYILPLSLMTFMYLRVAYTLWESGKMVTNDIRLQSFAQNRPSLRQRSVACCDSNIGATHCQKLSPYLHKASSPRVFRCATHGTHLEQENRKSWPHACPDRPYENCRLAASTKNADVGLSLLLCGACKDRPDLGNRDVCKSDDCVINNNAARENSQQRLLGETVLHNTSLPGPTSCSISLYRQHNCRSGRAPTCSRCSPACHHTCFSSKSRPKRYISCDFSMEASETTSTDEYEMQLAAAVKSSNKAIPRRVRVQYRVNSERVLNSRKRVIRLLVVVLLTFAVCVLPFHLKFVLLFWHVYPTPSSRLDILSPLAFVLLYTNSAINPILFWVFSDTFRRSLSDSLKRSCWK
ncbi:cholecystokinin receptor type a [Plakobranchus ocellatus]|uniref:Cholecystokinin receptor type a n=1 Tax=Plakobranchus ocellatus TaxID=259542 RepID=A0AAV4ABK0_9GAST|nr:cholecystokinin receptor type a [Plakobranchus ocellatus]